MARPPPHTYASDNYDSDDAPEAVSNSQSKLAAKKKEATMEKVESERKRKRKEENRKRDEALKRRKEENVVKGERGDGKGKQRKVQGKNKDVEDPSSSKSPNGGDVSRMSVEERMERAMREAQDEDDEEESGYEGEDFEHDALKASEDGVLGADAAASLGTGSSDLEEDGECDEEGLDGQGDEEGDEDDEEEDNSDVSRSEEDEEEDMSNEDEEVLENGKAKYLPDHIFASALSNSTSRHNPKGKNTDTTSSLRNTKATKEKNKKRKSRRDGPKDLIVGSKTIRTIPSTTTPETSITRAASRTVPPPKLRKLVKRTLALSKESVVADRRGGKRTKAGWERKIASMGNLRRSTKGPALRFVRS